MEVRFLHFTQSGKMSLWLDGCKLHMYIATPRAISKKTIQSNILRSTINRTSWKPKKRLNNPQEVLKKEKQKTKNRGNKQQQNSKMEF